jgi:ABC-type branched-subunit amino acid transport system ATPase component
MFEVANVSKRYGEKAAVDGLDFVVQPGTVTGFLGPNGAGKSTTMRMIAGLDEPTARRIRVNCRDYRAASAPRSTNCVHQPPSPSALSRDLAAAAVRRAHPEQGWSLLRNGVVLFEDCGCLLPDGHAIDRPAHLSAA